MNLALGCLLTFAVVLVTINGKAVEEDDTALLLFNLQLEADKGPSLTPEQQKCIQESVKKVVDDNPQLNWWWEEIAKSGKKLHEAAEKCQALEKPADKKRCLGLVKRAAKREIVRLVKLLPPEERPILGKLKEAVQKCLQ